MQYHAHRLYNERQIAQSYYDASSAEADQALNDLRKIDTALKQIIEGPQTTLGDVVQLTAKSISIAHHSIVQRFAEELGIRAVEAVDRRVEHPEGRIKGPFETAAELAFGQGVPRPAEDPSSGSPGNRFS